ncbi:MAG: Ig family protein, partial [Acidimicrobiaceae bacterium]
VILDGSGSYDDETSNVDLLSFNWFFIKVPPSSAITNGNLSGRNTKTPSFTPDRKGPFQIGLIVSDGFLNSTTAVVDITVVNSPPAADAGPDQNARYGQTVQLDGRGSLDVNAEDVLIYSWTCVSSPAGDPVTSGRF